MKLSYDPEVDTLDVTLLPGAKSARTQELAPGIFLDWDKKGRLIGLELLGASAAYPRASLEQLDDGTEWLTLAEAAAEGAKEGGPGAKTLRGLLQTGRIEGKKKGRDWLIGRHTLWNYLESRSAAGRPGRRKKRAEPTP